MFFDNFSDQKSKTVPFGLIVFSLQPHFINVLSLCVLYGAPN